MARQNGSCCLGYHPFIASSVNVGHLMKTAEEWEYKLTINEVWGIEAEKNVNIRLVKPEKTEITQLICRWTKVTSSMIVSGVLLALCSVLPPSVLKLDYNNMDALILWDHPGRCKNCQIKNTVLIVLFFKKQKEYKIIYSTNMVNI